jgi:hypothetical protein
MKDSLGILDLGPESLLGLPEDTILEARKILEAHYIA